MNRFASLMMYDHFDDAFVADEVRSFPAKLKRMDDAEKFFNIQPADLTEGQMQDLGFDIHRNVFNAHKNRPIRLIPLWLVPFLAENIDAECIDGKKITNKNNMDDENYFGCVAYGVIPKEGDGS